MTSSENSLNTPPHLRGFRGLALAILVPLARLRFVLVLGAIFLVMSKWDWLVAVSEKWVGHAHEAETSGDVEYYCPMHPTVVRNNNKEKCPICFMPLSKRHKGEETDDALPAGTVSRVQLSPYRIVLAGVRTEPVAYHTLRKEISTVGTVEFDERGLRNVSARFKGRIEQLFVNQTGQSVKKGDPLASLYSPDLVVTVQNFLDARRTNNADGEKIARDRLTLWGIEKDQIDEIAKSGKPITQLTIRSPIDGHVIKKYQREGQYVEEGGPLYDVADLSTVWVQAQLYEEDLPFLPRGAHDPTTGLPAKPLNVEAFSRARPGESFKAQLSFVFPHIDPDSRTLTVRFELANPEHELRPGMSMTVVLRIASEDLKKLPGDKRLRIQDGQVLAVAESGVIDRRQQIVYRQTQPNTFEGVLVELGPRMTTADGVVYFPVLKGIEPGDIVVTAGSFLIDAETRLNPSVGSIYIGGSGNDKRAPAVRPSTPEDMDSKITAALGKLPAADRALAVSQKFCPVLGSRLGSMWVPVKITLSGQPVFLCCKACISEANEDPAKTLKRVEDLKRKDPDTATKEAKKRDRIEKSLAKLSPADRALADLQRICPVTDQPLGAMGVPMRLMINNQPVFICCESCNEEALAKPDEMLRKVESFKKSPK